MRIPFRDAPVTDWKDYHQKRKHELATFLRAAQVILRRLGPPAAEPAAPEERGRGRPPYSPSTMLLVNLVRMQLRMSYRDMESLLSANPELRGRMGLPRVPGRDTIQRHAQALSESYLHRFNAQLTQRLKKTSYASASTPRVSRSTGTRDVGALPRTRNAAAPTIG
jgi:hypothetical protein